MVLESPLYLNTILFTSTEPARRAKVGGRHQEGLASKLSNTRTLWRRIREDWTVGALHSPQGLYSLEPSWRILPSSGTIQIPDKCGGDESVSPYSPFPWYEAYHAILKVRFRGRMWFWNWRMELFFSHLTWQGPLLYCVVTIIIYYHLKSVPDFKWYNHLNTRH